MHFQSTFCKTLPQPTHQTMCLLFGTTVDQPIIRITTPRGIGIMTLNPSIKYVVQEQVT
jgi:hypothetical protein